jgi:hypothetical protein
MPNDTNDQLPPDAWLTVSVSPTRKSSLVRPITNTYAKAFWARDALLRTSPKTPEERFEVFIAPLERILGNFERNQSIPDHEWTEKHQKELLENALELHAMLGMMPVDLRHAADAPKKTNDRKTLDLTLAMHLAMLTKAMQSEMPPDSETSPSKVAAERKSPQNVPALQHDENISLRARIVCGGVVALASLVAYNDGTLKLFILLLISWLGVGWLVPTSILGPRSLKCK